MKMARKKGKFTRSEALEYVFQHTNMAGAEMINVPYHTFATLYRRWKNGELSMNKEDEILERFGFEKVDEPKYRMKS